MKHYQKYTYDEVIGNTSCAGLGLYVSSLVTETEGGNRGGGCGGGTERDRGDKANGAVSRLPSEADVVVLVGQVSR